MRSTLKYVNYYFAYDSASLLQCAACGMILYIPTVHSHIDHRQATLTNWCLIV